MARNHLQQISRAVHPFNDFTCPQYHAGWVYPAQIKGTPTFIAGLDARLQLCKVNDVLAKGDVLDDGHSRGNCWHWHYEVRDEYQK